LLHSTATGIPPGGTAVAPTPNEFLFAGEQFDSDLNLYYNRARYLNVSTGRFWTMDTFEGDDESPLSLHKYLYVSADSANRIDPSGKDGLAEINLGFAIGQVISSITTLVIRGAVAGALFGAADALLQDKSGSDVFSEALKSGLIGAAIGPLVEVRFLGPVIVALGTVGGVGGVVDAVDHKNYPLAAFRGIATYLGIRAFVNEQIPTEPLPSGGRLGSAPTRAQLAEIAQALQDDGWTITGGGGLAPEEYLPPAGGGRKGGNYVDLTATKNGETLRINTIDTISDGITPTAREAAAAALIRSKIGPNDQLILIPKNK